MKARLYGMIIAIIFAAGVVPVAEAGNIKVSANLDKPYALAGQEQSVILKVGLIAEDNDATSQRFPLNIAIVLDKSGSMNTDRKIENAKQGVYEIIERLKEGDVISVVAYDTYPVVLVPAQVIRDKSEIIDMVSRIHPSGSTALYGGIELGAQELRKYMSDYALNKIVLLSDGLANVGPQSTEDLASLGRMLSEEDIIVSTIGVGLDYNEDLMTALAEESGGNSYFAKDSYELPRIFAEEINESKTYAAKDIKVYVDTEKDIEPLSIIGRRGEVNGKRLESKINALYGKNEKYALFEMKIPRAEHGANKVVANILVEYTDPATGKPVKKTQKINIQYHKDADFVSSKEDRAILKEVALTKTSEIKNTAIKLADEGKYEAAATYLSAQGSTLEKVAAQCNNDTEVSKEAKRCNWLSDIVSAGRGFSSGLRKSVVSESYSQTNQQYYDPGKERK